MESEEKISKTDNLVLVLDRKGDLGSLLIEKLAQDFLCVFLSPERPSDLANIVYIPLSKHIPVIPKATYASFVLFYNGERNLLALLPSFAKKAKEDNAKLYLIINIREASDELLNYVLTEVSRISIIILGDTFASRPTVNNPVTRLLAQARTGSMVLENDGLAKVYPVFIDDVIVSLHRLLTHQSMAKDRVIYLLPPHGVTLLSFARALRNKEPLLQIDLVDTVEKKKSIYAPPEYTSLLGAEYEYKDRLPATIIELTAKSKSHQRKKQKKRAFTLPYKKLLAGALVMVFVVFGTTVVTAILGVSFLSRARDQLLQGQLQKAQVSAIAAKDFFQVSDTTFAGVRMLGVLGLKGSIEKISGDMQTGEKAADALSLGINGALSIEKVLRQESLDPKQALLTGMRDIKEALIQFSSLQAEGKIPEKFHQYAQSFDKANQLMSSMDDVLPDVLGMNGKRTYLVLFQNNMELRPGGGFIGSYAVMDIENAKMTNFRIDDIYNADGQLKEHVEAPFQLRRYLGASHWFMRDSNFDIDFAKSAASAASFYALESGKKVDGVIAIDTTFIRSLLRAIGPRTIVGYNEKLTADNFFMLTETHAEKDFFPGSTQKKDFLNAVYTNLFTYLTESKTLPYLTLASAISESVIQKHILFTFPNKEIQQVFTFNDMSSELVDMREQTDTQVNDYFGINEANLGMNKVNYYLDRAIVHTVDIHTSGSAIETATVLYHNRSTHQQGFGGNYKSYLRFILPLGAMLDSVKIDGSEQKLVDAITSPEDFLSPRFVPPAGLEVEHTEEAGKTIYGFLITVLMNTEKKITIAYTVPMNNSFTDSAFSYSLRLFKQPGTGADPYSVTVTYPNGYKGLTASNGVVIQSTNASLLTTLAEDKEIKVEMRKR